MCPMLWPREHMMLPGNCYASHKKPRLQAFSNEVVFKEEYDDIEIGCSAHEFQCRTGECVDTRRVCDGRMDCLDGSDEAHCGVERHAAIPPEQLQQQPTHRPQQQQQQPQHRGGRPLSLSLIIFEEKTAGGRRGTCLWASSNPQSYQHLFPVSLFHSHIFHSDDHQTLARN